MLSGIARLGFALILVVHDPLEVGQPCHSLALLEAGQIAEYGPLADAAQNPQTSLAKALTEELAETG